MSILSLIATDPIDVPQPQFSLELPRRLARLAEMQDDSAQKMISKTVERRLREVYRERREKTKRELLSTLRCRARRLPKGEEAVVPVSDVHFEKFMRRLMSVEEDGADADE